MIKFLEYACLAAHVYSPGDASEGGMRIYMLGIEALKKDFKPPSQVAWYRLADIDPSIKPHNHFYSQLYLKFENARAIEAVMAIRGTVPSDVNNDWQDVASFWSDVAAEGGEDAAPDYLHHAILFYGKCRQYLSAYFPHIHTIKLTGHSLGGAIAQLMPLQAGYGVPAVVFNSSGCGHVAGVKKEMAGWIYNVNGRYEFISKIGLTLGHLYLVDVPPKEQEAQRLFASFDSNTYRQSQQMYMSADGAKRTLAKLNRNAQGFGNRFYAYLESLDKLNDTPSLQQKYINCQAPLQASRWIKMKAQFLRANCNSKALAAEYTEVIMEQHSMLNMVAALQLPQNHSVAFTSV